jgi:Domain of unknown function (DUF4956)
MPSGLEVVLDGGASPIGGATSHKLSSVGRAYPPAMMAHDSGVGSPRRIQSMIRLALGALLFALGGPSTGTAQSASASPTADVVALERMASQDTISGQSSPEEGLSHHQRKVTRPLGELEPVVEWQWGAILATALAMMGAILLTLPVALAYMWTKPAHEYDPSVMHSSIILAPTIAGILIVIQGSLAMAFSLAGVATAVRFRNSLKDTNDAVYVFVAVAIGLAAGVQALDIALAISLIFSAIVVLLSRSPFRNTGTAHQPAHAHHQHHHNLSGATPSGGRPAGASAPPPAPNGSPWVEYITIRTSDPEAVRPTIEAVFERETKRWRLERTTREANGGVTLLYAVRCRKRTPYDLLLAALRASAGSQEFSVEATPALQHSPAPALSAPFARGAVSSRDPRRDGPRGR